MTGFRVIIGTRWDRTPTEYYLGFDGIGKDAGSFTSVRTMLNDHIEELRRQVAALSAVLSTDDPEVAERYLQDGARLQISEVVLRPRIDAENVAALADAVVRALPATPPA